MKAIINLCAWCALMGVAEAYAQPADSPVKLKAGETMSVLLDSLSGGYDYEVKAALSGNRNANGIGKASWCIGWEDGDGKLLRRLDMKWGNECLGDPTDRRFMCVTVDSLAPDGRASVMLEKRFYDGVDLYGGYNTLSLESTGESMDIWVGNDQMFSIGRISGLPDAARIVLSGNRDLKVDYMTYLPVADLSACLQTNLTDENLSELNCNAGGIEGKWVFLDRDTNARWAEPGGKYNLAVMKHDASKLHEGLYAMADGREPAYVILYMGNGVVNASAWHDGMVKGLLYPTVFSNHFDLVWFDSYMEPMDEELSADLVDGTILSFNFPLLHSVLRFTRLP